MIHWSLDDRVLVAVMDRPERRNALDIATVQDLQSRFIGRDAPAGPVVLTGAGSTFCSGFDLTTRDQGWDFKDHADALFDAILAYPAPVIAALNGHAFGGGAEVAVAADIRIAADDVKIAFNQVKLEIMPAWGGAERLAALVGKSRALLLAGTGTPLGAAEAERIGLVDVVFPRSSFEAGWRSVATSLARRPATEIKRVIRGVSPDEAIASFARLWVADAHWQAAERVMNRNGPRREIGGAT